MEYDEVGQVEYAGYRHPSHGSAILSNWLQDIILQLPVQVDRLAMLSAVEIREVFYAMARSLKYTMPANRLDIASVHYDCEFDALIDYLEVVAFSKWADAEVVAEAENAIESIVRWADNADVRLSFSTKAIAFESSDEIAAFEPVY